MNSILSDKFGKIGKTPIALKEFTSLKEEMGKLNHPARPDIDWEKVEELCKIILCKNGADLQTLSFYTIALTKLYQLKGLTKGIDLIDTLIGKYWFNFWPEQTHIRVEIIAWLVKSIQQFLRSYQFSYADLTSIYHLERLFDHLCQNFQDLEIKHLTGMTDLYRLTSKTAKQLERLEQENSISNMVPVDLAGKIKEKKNEDLTSSNDIPNLTKQQKELIIEENNEDKKTTKDSISLSSMPLVQSENNPSKKSFWKGFITGACVIMFIGIISDGAIFYDQYINLKNVPIVNSHYFPENLTDSQINILAKLAENKISKETTDNILTSGEEILNRIEIQPLWSIYYGDHLIKLYQSLFPQNTQVTKLQKQWQNKQKELADQYIQTNTYQTIQNQLQSFLDRLNELDERRGQYITVSELKSIVFSIQKPLFQSPPLDELLRQMKEQKKQQQDTTTLQQQINIRFIQLLNYYYMLQQSK
ncbi:VasL domain-containing protein [Commensalibacter oyaizuii]|uniref:VasL domain-containing protein n=1 Tax=Commensalibacter oyaizuii TaxID=3043873 RepID=A0ABT6Q406_9PROT|nr:VasL domain-containing protein [Commensalibacter sp. TBRC 16381]MDI2091864.1 VasL domain-containing protein [Commensalibacter sp. TBRC 16381]